MKEQERSRKAELKDETAKQKQLAKERKKLEKHKFSEKDIVAVIDLKVLSGSVGGPLLTMFSQKDLRSEIFSSPLEKSIVLRIETPKDISQIVEISRTQTSHPASLNIRDTATEANRCPASLNRTEAQQRSRIETAAQQTAEQLVSLNTQQHISQQSNHQHKTA